MRDTAHFDIIAERAANAAGAVIRPYFRTRFDIATKADRSFVTEADRGAEQAIRQILQREFPDHGIVGEEFGLHQTDAEFCWILDPIDGTHGFMAGMPIFGTLIGLYDRDGPLLGILEQPVTRERWVAGASRDDVTFNGAPVQTRRCPNLGEAILFTTSTHLFDPPHLAAYNRLTSEVRLCRYSADCYAYGLLAMGHVDVVVESGLHPHDIAAILPIVERAGGCVTDWQGQPISVPRTLSGNLDILALGDPRLLDNAVSLLTAS